MTVTNQEIADAFRVAKNRLWNGHHDGEGHAYICHALETAYNRQECSIDAWYAARNIVVTRMGQRGTLFTWLSHVAKIPEEQLTPVALQTYRHEWLDHLIKEFSK